MHNIRHFSVVKHNGCLLTALAHRSAHTPMSQSVTQAKCCLQSVFRFCAALSISSPCLITRAAPSHRRCLNHMPPLPLPLPLSRRCRCRCTAPASRHAAARAYSSSFLLECSVGNDLLIATADGNCFPHFHRFFVAFFSHANILSGQCSCKPN